MKSHSDLELVIVIIIYLLTVRFIFIIVCKKLKTLGKSKIKKKVVAKIRKWAFPFFLCFLFSNCFWQASWKHEAHRQACTEGGRSCLILGAQAVTHLFLLGGACISLSWSGVWQAHRCSWFYCLTCFTFGFLVSLSLVRNTELVLTVA